MVLDRLDDLGIELVELGRGAERAVAHVAAGAAGDLRDLGRAEAARRAAVELDDAGEGDMVQIHVEAHADRVGRDQVIDLARLEEPDLRVPARAGSRRPAPRRCRRAGAASARRARTRRRRRRRRRRCAAAAASPCARRDSARSRSAGGSRTRRRRRGGGCSGFTVSAPSIIVSARPRACSSRSVKTWPRSRSPHSWISSTARKSTGRSSGIEFDRAHEIRGVGRDDLLFAGDERDLARALHRHHPVVILAGEETQREADHPGAVAEHALDGEMRLAGIGRPENGQDASSGKNAHAGRIGCFVRKRK